MAFLRHLLLFIVTMITIIPGENRCVPPYFLNDGECYEQHGCNQDSDCDGCNVNCEIGNGVCQCSCVLFGGCIVDSDCCQGRHCGYPWWAWPLSAHMGECSSQ
eukprot:420793_1